MADAPKARRKEERTRRSRPRRKGSARRGKEVEITPLIPPREEFDELVPAQPMMMAPRPVSQVLSATTTATTENRREDKERVERDFQLPEVGDPETIFLDRRLNVLARGYERVVYGDHGPYIELTRPQIHWQSFPHYRQKHQMAYYDEYWSNDMRIMICAQRRPVSDRPNPPRYGKFSVCNNRPEGYADYQSDRYYLAPDPEFIIVHRPSHLARPAEQLLVGDAPPRPSDTTLESAWRERFNALANDRTALVAARDKAEDRVTELEDALEDLKRQHSSALEENVRLRAQLERGEGGTGTGVLVDQPPSSESE